MSAQHTPGPWEIAETVKSARLDNARMIRPVDHHNYDYGATAIVATSEADAHLIASAPDLLDILEKILKAHESGNNGAYMGEAVLCDYFARMAKQVIAKAKGESV